MNSPHVSIIIPVYNTGDILNRCVDSILVQSFGNWEAVLIDDGSDNHTAQICDKCASKDNRIRVIHKINGGVSSARNRGINEAKGEWISFIDADDYVKQDFLEKLVDNLDADFIVCGFVSSQHINVIPNEQHWNEKNMNEGAERLITDKYLLYTPWCKLFKKSILEKNRLLFDTSLRLSEDTVFCYQYLYYVQSARVVSSSGYFYDGIWGGGRKYSLSLEEVLYIAKMQTEAIKNLNKRFHCNIDYRYKGYRFSHLKNLYKRLTLLDIYNYYRQNNDKITWDEFQNDTTFNLLQRSFNELTTQSNLSSLKNEYKKVVSFYTKTKIGSKGLSFYVRLFAFLINYHFNLLNILYLKLYSAVRNWIHKKHGGVTSPRQKNSSQL